MIRGVSEEGEDLTDLIPSMEKLFNSVGLTLKENETTYLKNDQEIATNVIYKQTKIDKNEFDLEFKARITQIILLSTGLLEAIDPIGMDPAKLARYVLSLFSEQQSTNSI